ncbi:hypothetical protein DAPPUDRAFT_238652 [Daphnia pulex]|uniref:Uncharacterized protein n=1 Tax=Daphnia pulex TaxID=6669 RepID=E9G715_DAPPU|nr:hypothetical protein DAPPUDRAFT_238652 [Daphnia pulex]|eukprot:EFX84384.1 hypothetical protein DAPPUDRAFT_238652 [Daphnia pulex]
MPVSSIPLCRKTDQEDTKENYLLADVKEEEEEVSGGGHVGDPCHHVISSASSLMLPANPCDDNLSVASPNWQKLVSSAFFCFHSFEKKDEI